MLRERRDMGCSGIATTEAERENLPIRKKADFWRTFIRIEPIVPTAPVDEEAAGGLRFDGGADGGAKREEVGSAGLRKGFTERKSKMG